MLESVLGLELWLGFALESSADCFLNDSACP